MSPGRPRAAWPLVLGAIVGCGPGDTQRSEAERDPPAAAEAPAPAGSESVADEPADSTAWTVGTLTSPAKIADGVATLGAVRVGRHEGYERVTLELAGGGSGLPAYYISYIDRPLIECGSGREIQPVGDAWLEIRMEPLDAHTQEGQPTVAHGPQDLSGTSNLLRSYMTCDFEAVTTMVLAMRHPDRFRAFTLDDPPRIVVDVELPDGTSAAPR